MEGPSYQSPASLAAQFSSQYALPARPSAEPKEQPRWYALWTRSRHEKRVYQQLSERGLRAFLPVSNEIHWWSDRRKQIEVPLFPGYTFLHVFAGDAVRAAVMRIPGVAGFVGWNGAPLAIPDDEIESIQRLLAHRVALSPHDFLKLGSRVRIRGGALDGIEGILLARQSDC
ncbi:MAG: transcription termination/antitermination protein NusG, partial [Candidatus Acidiferrales bacterium]